MAAGKKHVIDERREAAFFLGPEHFRGKDGGFAKAGILTYERGGEEWAAALAPVSLCRANESDCQQPQHWYSLVTMRSAAIQAPAAEAGAKMKAGINKTMLTLVIIILASGVIAGFFGALRAHGIVSPIRKLNHEIDRIAEGRIDDVGTVTVTSGDEIEALANNFNRMTNSIKMLYEWSLSEEDEEEV